MMKTYIRIFIATSLLLCACKTQKPIITDGVAHTPAGDIQQKADTTNYNYLSPKYYGIPKKIFKELENYEMAFIELKAMLEETIEPNFERAVFISENAYNENKYSYDDFQYAISQHQFFIETLIAANDKSGTIDFNIKVNQYGRFNLDDIRYPPNEKKELYQKALINSMIFKYLTDTIYTLFPNDSNSMGIFYHTPYTYASKDPFGIKNWSNSQVLNLLISKEQKGNCFALTAFYKILSDRMKSDARICTAHQHIYIQHKDEKGDYYNVELATAGHPGDGTIQTLTHTTTDAIKSGIALRSYDSKQSVGLCLVNLAKSYEHKFGSKDDDFLLKCAELVLKHDRLNLNALLLKQQVLDARVKSYSMEKNINEINKLKANPEISQSIYELEKHIVLLCRLGYRQMPFDMQKIIMSGIMPEDFEDKNPRPFTTIDPKDEHRKKFTTLYGGLFQEVFVTKEFEQYGHFIFQTSTNKLTLIDTSAQTGFLIDPVAFAYDFGARMFDSRVGIFTSRDPHESSYPHLSPYSAFGNNPIIYIDPDGRDIVYFDCEGNEIKSKRVTSDEVFMTYVQTGTSANKGPVFEKAPMPNRITVYSAYEKAKNRDYNKYDYDIAAQTFLFNQDRKDGNLPDKGVGGDPSNTPELTPNTVKAVILKETLYGSITSKNGDVDIMQVNVTGDWSDKKSRLGLTKGSTKDYKQSISAGITWLYWKGVTISTVKDEKGKITGHSAAWTGGDDWNTAVKRYNGGGDVNYMDKFNEILKALDSGASSDGYKEQKNEKK